MHKSLRFPARQKPRGFSTALFAALCLFSAQIFAQSPWTRSKGGFYSQIGWHFIPRYDVVFDAKGEDGGLLRKISEGTLQGYGEYGIAKKTTLVASVPLKFIASGQEIAPCTIGCLQAGKVSGLGNVSLAVRQNLYSKNLQIAATLRADLPAGKYDDATGIRLGYDAWTLVPMLSAGMGFKKAFVYGYGGYGFRGGGYSPFVQLGAEGGLRFGKIWVIGFLDVVQSGKQGDIVLPIKNLLTRLYLDRQQYVAVGLKGIFEFSRFGGVFVSAAGVADARNLPKSPGLGAGAFFKWE